jgi:hypothetical protein
MVGHACHCVPSAPLAGGSRRRCRGYDERCAALFMVRPAIPGTADRGPGATVLSALSCRRAFHAAARTWALDAIVDGTLTIVEITNDAPATRAQKHTGGCGPPRQPTIWATQNAPSKRSGSPATGHRSLRLGRAIVYDTRDLDAWLASRRHQYQRPPVS